MAQADYVVANGTGAAVRSDLNGQLAAIVSNNSGVTEPSTTYAYQWWADTTTGLLKLRNAANNAWITIGTLADANLGLLSLAGGTLTGALLVDDSGTAALPAIAFDGDTNTGIFRPAADQLGIATNGVERVEFGTTEVVFNDGGADVDFRIEGDTNANLFKVDAGLDQVQVANLNGGPLAGFRNLLINANPTINQRGYVSGTVTTVANQYTLDRWRVVTSGQKIDFTDSSEYRAVAAPAGGCEQLIEGASVRPGTYTLNWVGTATATVDGNAVSKGGNITLAGGSNVQVRFINGTFALPQLEPGAVATPFEQRPIGTELALCQRYFEKSYPIASALGAVTALGAWESVSIDATNFYDFGRLKFTTRKRATPTISLWSTNGVSGSLFNVSLAANQGNSRVSNISDTGAHLDCGNASMTTNNAFRTHWAASAEL
jgi:hypothetical protein